MIVNTEPAALYNKNCYQVKCAWNRTQDNRWRGKRR